MNIPEPHAGEREDSRSAVGSVREKGGGGERKRERKKGRGGGGGGGGEGGATATNGDAGRVGGRRRVEMTVETGSGRADGTQYVRRRKR